MPPTLGWDFLRIREGLNFSNGPLGVYAASVNELDNRDYSPHHFLGPATWLKLLTSFVPSPRQTGKLWLDLFEPVSSSVKWG